MSYNHLTIFEREKLLKFQAQGISYRAIALKLHRSPSTISREGEYSPFKRLNSREMVLGLRCSLSAIAR